MLFVVCWFFFKINFLKRFFQEYHRNFKQFGPWSGPTIRRDWPDLCPNCFQRLSADDTGRQRVKRENIVQSYMTQKEEENSYLKYCKQHHSSAVARLSDTTYWTENQTCKNQGHPHSWISLKFGLKETNLEICNMVRVFLDSRLRVLDSQMCVWDSNSNLAGPTEL